MGPAAGPVATNGLLDKLVLPSWERFNLTAHYVSNSWTNGLLKLGTVESSSPQWVQQLD